MNLNGAELREKIINAFPRGCTPRMGQVEIVEEIIGAMNNGYEYIVLEAGTGTGKSFIAATLANLLENKRRRTFIVTSSKQLQGQYERDFGYKKVLGRSNFTCLQNGETCDEGYCRIVPASARFSCEFGFHINNNERPVGDEYGEVCPYWEQKWEAIQSSIVLMNYPYFLGETNYSKQFSNRSLCIFDEAHNIEQQLMSFIGNKVNFRSVQRDTGYRIVYRDSELEDAVFWESELLTIIKSYEMTIKELNELIKLEKADKSYNGVTDKQEARLRTLEAKYKISKYAIDKVMTLEKRVETFNGRINNLMTSYKELKYNKDNWAVCKNINKEKKVIGVEFKPVFIKDYANSLILNKSIVKLFMSATILDSSLFMEWLGVESSKVYTIHVPSPFEAKRRPIVPDLAGYMTFRKKKESMPASIPILERILSEHEDEKGIIHTNSYTFCKYILRNIGTDRFITHSTENREDVINSFKATDEPKVLVSPSITEGVDLPYDECSFQVIYKIPYPFLGDNQIRKRNEQDKAWYMYKTVLSFVQAYGRGMRAVDDSCVTYVVDSSFNRLIGHFLMPVFVKEAVRSR